MEAVLGAREGDPDTDALAAVADLGLAVGAYITSDNRLLTIVSSCAASPADDGGTVFTFPILEDGDVETLATVELSVMKSGTITVTSSEVDGFVRDTDGNWIAD